ncbi:MAG: hypothetical protein BGP06_10570 [Rhizobiales bacterium 65-9]|nr:MAG: hypothetical protein BGP06_10570 [Rhizobiales bacterium 65-9]
MPLHPAIDKVVKRLAQEPSIAEFDVPEGRRRMSARPLPNIKKAPVASIHNVDATGRNGAIPIRIYTPRGSGPFPVAFYFHGGGFCYMDVDAYDTACHALCDGARAIVVSVEYRLAPEHPYPAGADDCIDAVEWFVAESGRFVADASRLALSGDSGGACLAAATALRIRDQGGPRISGLLLFYPMTDHYSAGWPSFKHYGGGDFGLRGDLIKLCWDSYLTSSEQIDDPIAVPMRAASLSRLPETLVQTAEYDLLRDEGEAFANRLRKDNVKVDLVRCDGLNHGFLSWWGILPEVNQRVDEACAWLRRALAVAP